MPDSIRTLPVKTYSLCCTRAVLDSSLTPLSLSISSAQRLLTPHQHHHFLTLSLPLFLLLLPWTVLGWRLECPAFCCSWSPSSLWPGHLPLFSPHHTTMPLHFASYSLLYFFACIPTKAVYATKEQKESEQEAPGSNLSLSAPTCRPPMLPSWDCPFCSGSYPLRDT